MGAREQLRGAFCLSYGVLGMTIRRRLCAMTGATVLAAGLAIGATVVLPGGANATSCTGTVSAAASCTSGGTVTLSSGGLTLITPGTLAWSATLDGASQTLYDTTAGTTGTYTSHEAFYALDYRGLLSGAGSGWNVTATATTFTGTVSTSNTIADNGSPPGKVLSFGGGGTPGTASNTPTAQCEVALTCISPTTSVSGYPLFILTGTSVTPTKIYNAPAASGSGLVQIGSGYVTGANPAVFAVTIPALQTLDTYTSTITMSVSAGP